MTFAGGGTIVRAVGVSMPARIADWLRALGVPAAYRRAREALVDVDAAQLSESGQRARREAIRERRERERRERQEPRQTPLAW